MQTQKYIAKYDPEAYYKYDKNFPEIIKMVRDQKGLFITFNSALFDPQYDSIFGTKEDIQKIMNESFDGNKYSGWFGKFHDYNTNIDIISYVTGVVTYDDACRNTQNIYKVDDLKTNQYIKYDPNKGNNVSISNYDNKHQNIFIVDFMYDDAHPDSQICYHILDGSHSTYSISYCSPNGTCDPLFISDFSITDQEKFEL